MLRSAFSGSRVSGLLACCLAAVLLSGPACRKATRVTPGLRMDAAGAPLVRVRLVNGASRVSLGADQGALLSDAAGGNKIALIPPGQRWDVVLFGPESQLRAAMPDGRVSGHHPEGIRVEAAGGSKTIEINGRQYRGAATVFAVGAGGGGLMAVNTLPLEEYLVSVVPAEMGQLDMSRLEAMKAQAVASRSFAMSRIIRNRQFAFDLTADTGDQVYKGTASETPVAERAVMETFGECLTMRGEAVAAFYHSCCGGRTADPGEVWGERFAEEAPYLESVKDDDYDRQSKWSSWTVKWTRRELLDQLKKSLPGQLGISSADIGEPTDIEVVGKGPSGRNTLLKVATDKRIFQVRGDQIRRVLSQPDGRLLPSTWFELKMKREGSEPVIVAEGRGNGHGLGLCQWGATARAANGQSYGNILKHYYKGVRLARLY
ncbi:MAG: SpoIID/LytB domain-containing protein [Candidatus Glassbacteria bacterium]|nr:SpoIID/LytB domain-containing protein [Candidatus Glassbacteria bacterium]